MAEAKKPKQPEATAKAEVRNPFKTAVQNLAFHNFQEVPKFVGLYKDTVVLGDESDSDKLFNANIFVDYATGEEVYVQDSYSISKSIKLAKADLREEIVNTVFEIEFLGKTTVKGKPFNQFKVGYCLEDQYEEYLKSVGLL